MHCEPPLELEDELEELDDELELELPPELELLLDELELDELEELDELLVDSNQAVWQAASVEKVRNP